MKEGTHPAETREPEALERDIDRTRTSLGRTIDELETRLSPGQLVDQAMSMGRQHGGKFAANLGHSVENNPVPMLLTAVGIAWMMMSSNEPRAARHPSRYGEPGRQQGAKDRMTGGVESAKSAAGAVGDRASRARHAVGDTVSHTGERVRAQGERMRMQGERMRDGFSRLMDEQPLLVGAMGIAIGAALGAALPRTESEDRLLGDTSEAARRSMKERATSAYEEVRDRAAELAPAREQALREQAGGSDTRVGNEQTAMPQSPTEDVDEFRRDH